MSLISTLEHAYASAVTDLRKVGKFITGTAVPALQAIHADAATIEAVTGLISPQLENVERTADALLGAAIKAIEDAEAAAGAGGVNIALDATLIADIKAIIPLVKSSANTAAVKT